MAAKVFEYLLCVLADRSVFLVSTKRDACAVAITNKDITGLLQVKRFGIPREMTFYEAIAALEKKGLIDVAHDKKELTVNVSRCWQPRAALHVAGADDRRPFSESYLPLPVAIVKSKAYASLSGSACRAFRFLLFCVSRSGAGPQDAAYFKKSFFLSYREAEKLHIGSVTYRRVIRELTIAGLIDVVKLGTMHQLSRDGGGGGATTFCLSARWRDFGLPTMRSGVEQLSRTPEAIAEYLP